MAVIYEKDSGTNCYKNFYFQKENSLTSALSTDEETRKKMVNPNNYQKVIKMVELEPDFQRILAKHNLNGKKKRSYEKS